MPLPLLRAEPLELKLRRPFTISRGTREIAENVLVEIEVDGVIGRGEAAPNARYGQSQRSVLLALDEFQSPQEAFAALEPIPLLQAFSQQFPNETAARAALEMALWDWLGHKTGRPLCRLLGIDPAKTPRSSYTISIDSEEETAARIREAAAWPALKLKMGGGDTDRKAVEILRAHSDKPFRIDANEAWDETEAAEKIEWLSGMGCELVEQPLPAGELEAVARLRERSSIPLIADEDVTDLMALDAVSEAYDGINVKLMKCGGIRDAIQLIHAARGRGMGVMLGCMIESTLAISAAAHLSPLVQWADLDSPALLKTDPFGPPVVQNGQLSIPNEPGLGVLPQAT